MGEPNMRSFAAEICTKARQLPVRRHLFNLICMMRSCAGFQAGYAPIDAHI
jgi:hypothetical protein